MTDKPKSLTPSNQGRRASVDQASSASPTHSPHARRMSGAGKLPPPPAESDAVKVVCRVRPFNQREIDIHQKSLEGKEKWEQQPMRSVVEFSRSECLFLDHEKEWMEKERFQFDFCYWSIPDEQQKMDNAPFVGQEVLFNDVGLKVIEQVWKGYNTCLFAYGQTGSGKTYSMMGPDDASDPGVIPRLCKQLFEDLEKNLVEAAKHTENYVTMYRVEVRFLELYNEQVKDLLWSLSTLSPEVKAKVQPENMKIRVTPNSGAFVENLTAVEVDTWQKCVDLINKGNSSRTVAATKMNDRSSRSHAVFTIKVLAITQTVPKKQFEKPTESTREALMNLVDLAGSERVRKSGAEGARMTEAININKSLLTLKRVIDALVDNSTKPGKKQIPPYRESHLTSLLKESLGGNSKTYMLVCVSPHIDNAEESLQALRYAARARQIVNIVRVNEDAAGRRLLEMEEELDKMKAELDKANTPEMIDALKAQIAEHEGSITSMEEEVVHQQQRINEFKDAKERENKARHAMAFLNLHKLAQARLKKDQAVEDQEKLTRRLSIVRHEKEDLTTRQQTAEKEQERLHESIETQKVATETLDKEIDFWKSKNLKLEAYKAELMRTIEDQERDIERKKEEKYARMFLSKFESAKIRQEFDRQMHEQEQKHADELNSIIVESQAKYEALVRTCVDREDELEKERKALQQQLTQIANDLKLMESERTSQIQVLDKEVNYLEKEKTSKQQENKLRLEQTIRDWTTKYDNMVHDMEGQHKALCQQWEQKHFQDVSNEEERFSQAKAQFHTELEATQRKWDDLAHKAEEEWENKWKRTNGEWQARLNSKIQHNQEMKSHLKNVEQKELKYSALLHRVTAVLEGAATEGPADYLELVALLRTFQQEYQANQPSKYKLQQLLRGENLKFRCQPAPVVGVEETAADESLDASVRRATAPDPSPKISFRSTPTQARRSVSPNPMVPLKNRSPARKI